MLFLNKKLKILNIIKYKFYDSLETEKEKIKKKNKLKMKSDGIERERESKILSPWKNLEDLEDLEEAENARTEIFPVPNPPP